jgi:hypothetical protein
MTREAPVQKRFAARIGAEPVLEESEDTISPNHNEAFKAMMSAPKPTKPPTNDDSASKNRKKKGGGIKKNKAHKVRR